MEELAKIKTEKSQEEGERYHLSGFMSPLQVLMMELDNLKKKSTLERRESIRKTLEKIDMLSKKIPLEQVTNPLDQKLLKAIREDIEELVREGSKVLVEKGDIDKTNELIDRITMNRKKYKGYL